MTKTKYFHKVIGSIFIAMFLSIGVISTVTADHPASAPLCVDPGGGVLNPNPTVHNCNSFSPPPPVGSNGCFKVQQQGGGFAELIQVECSEFPDDILIAHGKQPSNSLSPVVNEAPPEQSVESTPLEDECTGSISDTSTCGITRYLLIFTNALSAIVGIVIVIMLVVGGIQYSMARDNPQAVQAARGHIMNALLALLVYIFMFAFLQYIIPGGVLNG